MFYCEEGKHSQNKHKHDQRNLNFAMNLITLHYLGRAFDKLPVRFVMQPFMQQCKVVN